MPVPPCGSKNVKVCKRAVSFQRVSYPLLSSYARFCNHYPTNAFHRPGIFVIPAHSFRHLLVPGNKITLAKPVFAYCQLRFLWLVGLALPSAYWFHLAMQFLFGETYFKSEFNKTQALLAMVERPYQSQHSLRLQIFRLFHPKFFIASCEHWPPCGCHYSQSDFARRHIVLYISGFKLFYRYLPRKNSSGKQSHCIFCFPVIFPSTCCRPYRKSHQSAPSVQPCP